MQILGRTVANKKFARISKTQILGLDARDDSQVAEVTNYLRAEEIIDPRDYFTSQRIFPKKIANAATKLDNFMNRNINRILFPTVLLGAVGGLVYGYKLDEIINSRDNRMFIGAISGSALSPLIILAVTVPVTSLKGRNDLTKQRQNFEASLNYLDDEVRDLFPLNQNQRKAIHQLEAAVA